MKIIRESFGIQYILPTFAALINTNTLLAKWQNKLTGNIHYRTNRQWDMLFAYIKFNINMTIVKRNSA